MKPADVKILVQEGEGTTLEFKESLSASLAREMVALANTIGGKILLGVRDDGIVADIEDAMRFIERNTRTAWRIEALQRENIPEYPMKALREAITNAVMHRDWFVEGANVFVELYTDRIEIVSPGGLFKGMTLADLGHRSVRRNALIADLLHRIEFIEKAGTGIKRIRDEAHDQGCPEPRFESNFFFTATFRPNPEVRALVASRSDAQPADRHFPGTPQVTPEVTPEVLRLLGAMTGVMDRQSLQSALGLKAEKNFRLVYLRPALDARLIEMTIPDKPRSSKQRYRLTEAGRAYLPKNKEPT
jgi:ATP-dependent DNA helicase RecG